MSRPFTGRHMALIMVSGFGIVIAVNLLMATLAVNGFSGVVVTNSYVASQDFNGWLGQARAQSALGWDVTATRAADGRLRVALEHVPANAVLTAAARRPLGQPEHRELTFSGTPQTGFQSTRPLPAGRWLVRLTVVAGQDKWRGERDLP